MTRLEVKKAKVAMAKFDAGKDLSREEFEDIARAARFGLTVDKNRVRRGPKLTPEYGLEKWTAP